MSLEQAIHERWGTDFLLGLLLPIERLSTGTPRGATTMPYAVLTRRESQTLARTSSGTCLDRAVLQFTIWAAALDPGKQIVQAITRRFDRVDFALEAGYVLNMQRTSETESQADDGSWRFEISFVVIVRSSNR